MKGLRNSITFSSSNESSNIDERYSGHVEMNVVWKIQASICQVFSRHCSGDGTAVDM